MTLDTLETLYDEQLQAVITRAGELLKQRDRERKEKALAEARAILVSAGLSLKDIAAKGRNAMPVKPLVYRSGHSYQHPTKPELVWNARGQKPGWMR
ncbi:MAG: H-NS histone family protein, partial [Limisphaerales bacterium]